MNDVRVKLIIAGLALLMVGLAGGYWFARSRAPVQVHDDPGAQDRRILYWRDPMYPNARFDKPGKSPFMDMQLEPVYADEQGSAAVRLDPTVAQNLGIRLGTVERAALQPRLTAVGGIAFDERLLEVVQARVEGYVTKLHVKAPLERVRRGQPLADITAPAWLEAQEEYVALLDAQSERGRAIRDAARQRMLVLGVPEQTIRTLETQRRTNATTTLFAPIDGVVTELAVREGAAFMPGAALFRINGLGTVWLNLQVPEAQVSMVQPGAGVTARATGWPGDIFEGRVAALLPDVNAQTRTASVRVVLDNPDFKLAPGMFATAELVGAAKEEQLVAPSEAVIRTGERSVVIVARDGGGFDAVDVTVGREFNDRTEILSGLQEGQSIVLSGQFLIDSEASLRSTASRLSTAPESRQ